MLLHFVPAFLCVILEKDSSRELGSLRGTLRGMMS